MTKYEEYCNIKDMFDDMLRDCYGETTSVCGYDMDTADIFARTDPIADRCAFLDFTDNARIDLDDYIDYYKNDERFA